MTTIAAKKVNGKVHLAWDHQVTSGNVTRKVNKVVEINDQFAVGVAGHLRYANLIQTTSVDAIHQWDIKQPGFDGYSWVIQSLVPAWQNSVKKSFDNTANNSESTPPWGVALVALAGNIYSVGHDLSVCEFENFGAIGSGCDFAEAAMFLGKNVKQAVGVASALDLFTGTEIKEIRV